MGKVEKRRRKEGEEKKRKKRDKPEKGTNHSDSFVVINERTAHFDATRFLRIAFQLPLDLQMVLCNQIFGSPRDFILSRDSEPGFQLLTRTTTWQ